MATMFDQEWVNGFASRWNNAPEMTGPLGQAKFNSIIGFGYKDEELPRATFHVQDGKVAHATTARSGEVAYDWDLRADPERWEAWRRNPLTIMSLGVAVSQGAIQFKSGDYRGMIRRMHLAKPFLHFFTLL